MFYTIYKTTHTATGRYYIGAHQTPDLVDEYLGSGKRLANAVKKYGRDAFVKEVLFVFDNPEAMHAKEVELVTEGFVARSDTFNLIPGGTGGWWKVNRERAAEGFQELSNFGHQRQRELAASDPHFMDRKRDHCRALAKRLREEGRAPHGHLAEAVLSQSSRDKRKETFKRNGHGRGEKNSQHGTLWVSKPGEKPKKVGQEEFQTAVENGWVRGRKSL